MSKKTAAPYPPREPLLYKRTLTHDRRGYHYTAEQLIKEVKLWNTLLSFAICMLASTIVWLTQSEWTDGGNKGSVMTEPAWNYVFNPMFAFLVSAWWYWYATEYQHHPWYKLNQDQKDLLTQFRTLPKSERSRFPHFEHLVATKQFTYSTRNEFGKFIDEYNCTSPEADRLKRERELIAERNKELSEAFAAERKLRVDIRKELGDF